MSRSNIPNFFLEKTYSDGSKEDAMLYTLKELDENWSMGRRGFLITAGVGIAALSGCAQTSTVHLADEGSLLRGECADVVTAHRDTVIALCMSPDASLLASGSYDETVKIWELPSGKLLSTLRAQERWVTSLCFSPDGTLLAAGTGATVGPIFVWEMPSGKLIKTLQGHKWTVLTLCFSPDGTLLASGSATGDENVKLWEMPSGKLIKTLEGHKDYVRSVCFSPDGSLLASASEDETIKLWEMPSGSFLKTLDGYKEKVRSVRFSPDGTLLLSVSGPKTIKLWEMPSGNLLKTLHGHLTGWNVYSRCFSPDGTLLALGEHRTIGIWEIASGYLLACLCDPATLRNESDGLQYTLRNRYGQIVTYTLPCGSPIPPGAVCTCNCVPGTYKPPPAPTRVPSPPGGERGRYCTCVPICACVPIK